MTTPHRTLQMPNAGEVICPNCAHQFRAIPENVQSLLLASGHEPPFTASPAAPVPDGWVMVPREPTEDMIQAAAGAWGESEGGLHNAFAAALRGGIAASPAAPAAPVAPNGCEKIFTHKWLDPDCIEQGCKSLAAHVVPLTDEQIRSMWMSSEFRGNGGQADWFCEGIRAAEAHHGITGASK